MKLIYRIISRLSVALLLLMAAWAVAFYFIITDEINDETDDTLEDYAHLLITRALAGEELPSEDNGTNNTYHLAEVSEEYALSVPAVSYGDETVYISSLMETEPARVLRTIFRDGGDRVFELTVAIPSYEKADLQQRILWWILILYALLLVAVVAVNAFVVRRSFKPLYALLEWLDGWKLGQEVPPLVIDTNVTEFRKLGEAVMRTARRGGEMFDEQRLFTGNAAHELQTPIAVCRSRLEMLLADESLTEAQFEQVASVLSTLDRLAGLNKTLLLLARIDNRQFPESSEVDAGGILRRLADDYSEVYAGRSISVEVREDTPFVVPMNETLATVLWGNLLKNAFIHSPEGGRVDVVVGAHGVSVENDAVGASGASGTSGASGVSEASCSAGEDGVVGAPLDPAVIFRRFYRGGTSEGSAGLGLALVESICRLYGLRISYDFADGKHRFTVKIKD